jgi:hypothetical protein
MVLISATEKRTKKQMDDFVASVKEILWVKLYLKNHAQEDVV